MYLNTHATNKKGIVTSLNKLVNIRYRRIKSYNKNIYFKCEDCATITTLHNVLNIIAGVYCEDCYKIPGPYKRDIYRTEMLITYKDYEKIVRSISEKEYRRNKLLINPNDLKRSFKDYHLDHIKPIRECYRQHIHPKLAGSWLNLQMLHSSNNRKKSCIVSTVNNISGKWENKLASKI